MVPLPGTDDASPSGPNRRGRALALICRHYLEEGPNG